MIPLPTRTKTRIRNLFVKSLNKLYNSLNSNATDEHNEHSAIIAEKDNLLKTYEESIGAYETRIDAFEKYIDEIFEIGKKGKEFTEYQQHHISFSDEDVKPIAFYLPQFYTFPENDEWWGKGFTEWTNVTKSVPRYVGHYQPHLPYDSTFYDQSNFETIHNQIELAKNYGIYGFCYHYYWFNGKRLLEKPLNLLLNSEIDFPFCINWANENWSRRWDGQEDDILIEQKHSDKDDLACIKEICKYVQDKRYIRVNGKPLILIYNAAILPNVNNTIKIWRKYCKDSGIGDICIAGAQTYPTENPLIYDFDVAVEFPPHFFHAHLVNITNLVAPIQQNHGMNIFDIEEYIYNKKYYSFQPNNTYKSVFPNWDNTPRRGENGIVYQTSPELYKNWLLDVMIYTKETRPSEDRFVFINAWNEWAESAHLEPCRKYGYAYLQKTAEAINEINSDRHN